MRALSWGSVLLGVTSVVGACDLAEVVLAEPVELVIAEIYVGTGDSPGRATAFLQKTLGSAVSLSVPGADVRLLADGRIVRLSESVDREACLLDRDVERVEGSCYVADPLPQGFGVPGQTVEAVVTLLGGDEITGRTVIPGDFTLILPQEGTAVCSLAPETLLELEWSPSENAWAYLGESQIEGLASVIVERGLDAELDEDPLFLTGLSLSRADTTLGFPNEFGVFDRFDLDADLSQLLQMGLPAGTSAIVTVSAADRNFVNWVRGGKFNPSGSVRVPSLFGDAGTGVLGTFVRKSFNVMTDTAAGRPSCISRS